MDCVVHRFYGKSNLSDGEYLFVFFASRTNFDEKVNSLIYR